MFKELGCPVPFENASSLHVNGYSNSKGLSHRFALDYLFLCPRIGNLTSGLYYEGFLLPFRLKKVKTERQLYNVNYIYIYIYIRFKYIDISICCALITV